jgi:CheY-like chemotaxis protein
VAAAAARPLAAPVPAVRAADEPRAVEIDSILARLEPPPNPAATLPPGTPLKAIPRPERREPAGPDGNLLGTLDALMAEVRALRRSQEEILELLKARRAPRPGDGMTDPLGEPGEDEPFPVPPPPVRSGRRKTVLVIDDDDADRAHLVEVLERADIPVRVAADGSAGLAAIAQEKPDIIVLELDVGGVMSGKDVVNMIKATMEWIDIPIVLYTRVPVASQREARTVHGADDVVPKDAPSAAEALVAKVVTLFRKR